VIMNIFYDANKIHQAGRTAINSAGFKYSSHLYEMNHLYETAKLQKDLIEGKYKPSKGMKFVINERGKIRNITTNIMVDKTVNHLLCDNVLSPAISPLLVYDNSASQIGKGVHFHRSRFETHLHQFYRKYKTNDGYVLLVDFSGYYASIPHQKCLEETRKNLKYAKEDEKEITMNI